MGQTKSLKALYFSPSKSGNLEPILKFGNVIDMFCLCHTGSIASRRVETCSTARIRSDIL
mgnify:FL=1